MAVAKFNRYNEIQLVVGNPAIGAVRVSGNFEVTNVQSFLAALQRAYLRSMRNLMETTHWSW